MILNWSKTDGDGGYSTLNVYLTKNKFILAKMKYGVATSFQLATKTSFFALTKIQKLGNLCELSRAVISKLLGLWCWSSQLLNQGLTGWWVDKESFHFDIFDLTFLIKIDETISFTLWHNGGIIDRYWNYVLWYIHILNNFLWIISQPWPVNQFHRCPIDRAGSSENWGNCLGYKPPNR